MYSNAPKSDIRFTQKELAKSSYPYNFSQEDLIQRSSNSEVEALVAANFAFPVIVKDDDEELSQEEKLKRYKKNAMGEFIRQLYFYGCDLELTEDNYERASDAFFQNNDLLKAAYEEHLNQQPFYFIRNTLLEYFYDRGADFSLIPRHENNKILTLNAGDLLLTITASNIKLYNLKDDNHYDLPGEITAIFKLDTQNGFILQSVHTSTALLANIIDGKDVIGLSSANFQPNKRHLHDNLVYEAMKEDREFLSGIHGYYFAMERLSAAIAGGYEGSVLKYSKDLQSYIDRQLDIISPCDLALVSTILDATAELLFNAGKKMDTKAALKKLQVLRDALTDEEWAKVINEMIRKLSYRAPENLIFLYEEIELVAARTEFMTAMTINSYTVDTFNYLQSIVYKTQQNILLPNDVSFITSVFKTATQLLTKIAKKKDALTELKALENLCRALHERPWANRLEAIMLKLMASTEEYKQCLTSSSGYNLAQARLTAAVTGFNPSDSDTVTIAKALQAHITLQKPLIAPDDIPAVNAVLNANAELLNTITAGEDLTPALNNLNAARQALPNRKWAAILGALTLALLGAVVLTLALMITVHSAGVLTPISMILGQKGLGLMIAGVSMAVVSTTALALSGTFFAAGGGKKPALLMIWSSL